MESLAGVGLTTAVGLRPRYEVLVRRAVLLQVIVLALLVNPLALPDVVGVFGTNVAL